MDAKNIFRKKIFHTRASNLTWNFGSYKNKIKKQNEFNKQQTIIRQTAINDVFNSDIKHLSFDVSFLCVAAHYQKLHTCITYSEFICFLCSVVRHALDHSSTSESGESDSTAPDLTVQRWLQIA